MKFEKWQIPTVSAEAVRRLTEAGYPYLVSAVLVSRGITTRLPSSPRSTA